MNRSVQTVMGMDANFKPDS